MPVLQWLTREQDARAVSRTPCRLLEEVREESEGHADSDNLLIQSDNLEALKALLPFYLAEKTVGGKDVRRQVVGKIGYPCG